MTTVVEQDPVLAEVFHTAIGSAVAVVPSLDRIEDHLRSHPTERVVVLGPSVGNRAAADFAGRNRIVRPALGVILVRPSVDQAVLADALRSGMSEVVEANDATALREAVRRTEEVARAMSESLDHPAEVGAKGSLVTVFSTKGGVGKSLVATNVAASMADEGHAVCIVDLDVHCGDVAIMLQLTPLHSLADLSQLSGQIDASGVESLLTDHSERLSVLAAPVDLGPRSPRTPSAVCWRRSRECSTSWWSTPPGCSTTTFYRPWTTVTSWCWSGRSTSRR